MGRLMLWTIPRSKSTIILKSLSSNPEIKCIFEPLAFSYFSNFYEKKFGYSDLYTLLDQEPFCCDNIVWKDVPSFVESLDFEKLLAGRNFKHALLVRDPKQIALSKILVNGEPVHFMNFAKKFPEHPTVEKAFGDMLLLKNYLTEQQLPFKVFDSSDLGSNGGEEFTQEFLRALCEFGGLPFDKECMLKMESYDSLPGHWWLSPNAHMMKENPIMNLDFHGTAMKTKEFQVGARLKSDEKLSDENEQEVDRIEKYCRPIYERLLSQ